MNDTPCTSGDPDRFFPSKWATPRDIEAVKAECRPCPKREQCLAWVLEHPEPGIWAGTDEEQRKTLRAERGITATRARSDVYAEAHADHVRSLVARSLTVAEIAASLGITPAAASQVLYKARHRKAAS